MRASPRSASAAVLSRKKAARAASCPAAVPRRPFQPEASSAKKRSSPAAIAAGSARHRDLRLAGVLSAACGAAVRAGGGGASTCARRDNPSRPCASPAARTARSAPRLRPLAASASLHTSASGPAAGMCCSKRLVGLKRCCEQCIKQCRDNAGGIAARDQRRAVRSIGQLMDGARERHAPAGTGEAQRQYAARGRPSHSATRKLVRPPSRWRSAGMKHSGPAKTFGSTATLSERAPLAGAIRQLLSRQPCRRDGLRHGGSSIQRRFEACAARRRAGRAAAW